MGRNVPNIRFDGYTDEWKTTSLGDYFAVSTEKNSNDTYNMYDIYSVSREYGVINQIEYQGKSFAGASLTGYRVIHHGELVYTKSPLKAQPYGIIKVNKGESGIVSALYGVFNPNEDVDASFVQTYFELDSRLNDYLRPLVNKGAKNTLLIKDADAIEGNVTFPTSPKEQEKIGKLFATIDKLIRQLEAKLEKLRRVKQSLLRQMFTNVNGGGYLSPDIRFANFNQPWTVTELGEISTKVTEKNNDNSCQLIFTNSAEYGIIAQSEFFDRDIANADNIYSYYKVRPNMFVYNPRISVTAPVGPVNRNKSNLIGVMSPLYYVFEVRNIDYGFLEYMFKSNVWHRFMYMNGNSGARSDRFSISDKLFSKLPICHPKQEEEQQKIAEMLSLLDEDISNNALRLLKTRQIKQSLLKKMFA